MDPIINMTFNFPGNKHQIPFNNMGLENVEATNGNYPGLKYISTAAVGISSK